MMSWKAGDRRAIDPITKDYVVSDSGFETMNAVSQRVYTALSRFIPTEKKKTPYVTESTKAGINAALKGLVDAKLIDNVSVEVDDTLTATMTLMVVYRNLTIGKLESASLSYA